MGAAGFEPATSRVLLSPEFQGILWDLGQTPTALAQQG